MSQAYIGIDACFSRGKRLPVVICTWKKARLVPEPLRRLDLQPPRGGGNAAALDPGEVRVFANEARDYVANVCKQLKLIPTRIAIDAPSAPRAEGTARRAAERAMDQAGISCFTTPTAAEFEAIREKARRHLGSGGALNRLPHANQLWMLVGFELFRVLKPLAECIEVFPQAIVRTLGSGAVHKTKAGAVEAQLLAAAAHTGWPSGVADEPDSGEIAWSPAHDRLDAYLSAWVAALDESQRVALGRAPDDVIWVPGVEARPVPKAEMPVLTRMKPPNRAQAPSKRPLNPRQCPACSFTFRHWSSGWDAHAAHRCPGLSSTGAAQRKVEYKKRFGQLFSKP